jgi:tetratricopeptide (TPR) repeat protein
VGRRLPEAIAEYHAAIRLDPNYAEAHMNLGNALASSPGHLPEAITEYREALRIAPGLAAGHYTTPKRLSAVIGQSNPRIALSRAAWKPNGRAACATWLVRKRSCGAKSNNNRA